MSQKDTDIAIMGIAVMAVLLIALMIWIVQAPPRDLSLSPAQQQRIGE